MEFILTIYSPIEVDGEVIEGKAVKPFIEHCQSIADEFDEKLDWEFEGNKLTAHAGDCTFVIQPK